MKNDLKMLVIGCGKMGGALLDGALNGGAVGKENVRIVEKNADICEIFAQKGIKTADNFNAFADFSPDIVFLAVKPFIVADVLPDVKPFTDKGATVLSIVAGKKTAFYEKALGDKTPVIRAMPNTPALIGKGMSAAFANAFVSQEIMEKVQNLFETCGVFCRLDNEDAIDAVTAVSGSGPAYLFYFVEALKEAALKSGIPEGLCETFARQTVCGAAELLEKTGESPAVLRKNVTTPNGTTAAALSVFENNAVLFSLVEKAVLAAKDRSRELAG